VSRYQEGKTNLDFTEARDSEWQWHQLGHMQVCTLLQTDNHASTPPLSFLQAGCPSCPQTNSVKARVATRLGFPGMSRISPMLSRQNQPRDAKCPGFQGKVKMTKIIIITIVIINLPGARTRGTTIEITPLPKHDGRSSAT